MPIYSYCATSLATVATSLLFGFFVIYKNPKSNTHRSLFMLNATVAVWSLFLFLHYISKTHQAALLTGRLLHISSVFILPFYLLFIVHLLDIYKEKIRIIFSSFALSLILLCFSFTPFFIKDVSPKLNFTYYADAGAFYILWIALYLMTAIYALFLMIKAMPGADKQKKNQIRYVLIASVMSFAGGATIYPLWYGVLMPPFGEHIIFIYPIILAYAVLKHKLLDIEIVIRETITYSLLALFIGIIYLLMVLFADRFVAAAISAVIITILFTPVKTHIQALVDKFYAAGTRSKIKKEFEKFKNELEQSDKMKAIATLAAGMAHEIRNPLTAIKTFTEYLPEKFDDKVFREKFTRIVGAEVERINSTITQLLEFAKPKPLNLKNTDIHILLNDTVALLSEQLIKNKITVHKAFKAAAGKMGSDPEKLRHVFFNILKNAIESIRNGGEIFISTRQNKYLFVEIRDTGCGMTQEQLSRAYDPFFSNKENGTGLGLSIVHSIMKELKGGIIIKSELGEGTTVVLKIGS
ncbi:MAG: hypothetical protein JW946_00095 [Candidatus Omnitrophica bacterium]|nr:hypothetical protein [Candidatus Omnitrophota bacterium]